jgi:hypothetical protein
MANGWSYLFGKDGEKSALFTGDSWGTSTKASAAAVEPPARTVNGCPVEHDIMGNEYIQTLDGSRAYLDMSGSPVQPNSCSSSSAGLFGNMDGFYGNKESSASSSASSLYGYSPAAESNSMAGFYGTTQADTGSIWGASNSGGNGWCGVTGGLGQASASSNFWGDTSSSTSSSSSSGSSWCPMTGGMGNGSDNGGGNSGGGGLGW